MFRAPPAREQRVRGGSERDVLEEVEARRHRRERPAVRTLRCEGDGDRAATSFRRALAVEPANAIALYGAGAAAQRHRDLIVTLAARHKLPTVYFERNWVAAGGLVSYGADQIDQWRRAAGYVDRILKGGKPADLPVQAPTKYDLVINLKTAKSIGLDVPATVLARADEVIE